MAEAELLDRAHELIMSSIVATKQAPHYTELAQDLGTSIAQGREIVHELVGRVPGWVHPGTDYLASFPPFNLQPTHYRVSIDGEPGWFAQCGFEALAVRWLVPGALVEIDAPCLCCGEPIHVAMRDDDRLEIEPESTVGYTSQQVGGPAESRPFR